MVFERFPAAQCMFRAVRHFWRQKFDASSRGGNVARPLGHAMVVDLQHPSRALLEAALALPDHTAADEVFDELPHDVAMRAEHDIVEASIAEELGKALQALTFGQRRGLLDR